MKQCTFRSGLLSSAVLGIGLAFAASPANADSVCAFGGTTLPGSAIGVDCTDPNGNGHTEIGGGSSASGTLGTPPAVVIFGAAPTTGFTTGYIESTTAGKDVLDISSTVGFTYTGTGSTLVGQAGATSATTLDITAPDVTLFSGTLTALGAGSTALSVDANGGAGAGNINATIDGDISAPAGVGVVLTQSNAAGTGNIVVTSTTGNDITAGAGTGGASGMKACWTSAKSSVSGCARVRARAMSRDRLMTCATGTLGE